MHISSEKKLKAAVPLTNPRFFYASVSIYYLLYKINCHLQPSIQQIWHRHICPRPAGFPIFNHPTPNALRLFSIQTFFLHTPIKTLSHKLSYKCARAFAPAKSRAFPPTPHGTPTFFTSYFLFTALLPTTL